MIASPAGEFEAGMSQRGQTREHVLLARALGVRKLIVCCNKQDFWRVNYSQERFEELRAELGGYLRGVGFQARDVQFLPISGWTGENLTERSANLSWFDGPTLLEALGACVPPARRPLRLFAQDEYAIGGIGTLFCGRVESGAIRPSEKQKSSGLRDA